MLPMDQSIITVSHSSHPIVILVGTLYAMCFQVTACYFTK